MALGGAAPAGIPYSSDGAVKIALTTLGVAPSSVIYVFNNAIVGEITPAVQRDALLAIGSAIGTSAGSPAPYVTDSVIEKAATPLDGDEK